MYAIKVNVSEGYFLGKVFGDADTLVKDLDNAFKYSSKKEANKVILQLNALTPSFNHFLVEINN